MQSLLLLVLRFRFRGDLHYDQIVRTLEIDRWRECGGKKNDGDDREESRDARPACVNPRASTHRLLLSLQVLIRQAA